MELSGTLEIVQRVGELVDVAGVGLIVIGLVASTVRFLVMLRQSSSIAYQRYREGLGRALLLGLEFLVAADIIRTVAVAPDFHNVGVLAIIVLVRTFLSWSLEVELEGRWPWQRRNETNAPTAGAGQSHTTSSADTTI